MLVRPLAVHRARDQGYTGVFKQRIQVIGIERLCCKVGQKLVEKQKQNKQCVVDLFAMMALALE